MAGYTRTNTADIQSGTVVKSAPINAELNAVVAAMHATTGHKHDGTSAEGGPVTQLRDADGDTKVNVEESADEDKIRFDIAGTEQLIIQDGAIVPTTDNDIDLGTSSLEFKDGYFDGTIHVDTLDVDVNATVAGTLGVTGATTLGDILSVPDGSASAPSITNTGDTNCGLYFSASDEIAFTAGGTGQVIFADGSITGVTDNDIDLGSASYEFKDLYIDGTAHIDTLDIDENATVAGTLGVTGAVTLSNILSVPDGSASAPSITNTGDTNCGLFFSTADTLAFSAGGTAQFTMADGAIAPVTDNDVDLGTSSLEFKDLYLDGTAHIDTLDVDVNATVAGTLGVTGAITGSSTVQGTVVTATTGFAPDASDGAYLGTSSLQFSDLFLADGAVINLGDDQDVTLTHVADAGVLLNGTKQLQFGDSGTYIHQSADGVLDLVSDSEIEINATTIDINGNADVSGTLVVAGASTLAATSFGDADITNVGDIALDSISADGTDINVAVTDNSATAFTIKQGSDAYLIVDTANSSESVSIGTGVSGTAITIGHGTSEVTVGDNLTVAGNLTVTGTTTTVSSQTINVQNAFVFEGATADAHETTLSIVDPTADHTYYLPDLGSTADDGYLAAFAADPGSSPLITSTPTELNILDGDTNASSVTLADADRIVVNDDGTMKQVALTTLNTYIGSSTTTVGALNSGSITSGFGSINNGSSAITTTGTITYGSLSDGTITVTAFVDEDNMSSNSATLIPTQQSVKAYVDSVAATSNNVTGLTASGAELNVLDGASAGTIVNSKGVIYSSGGKVNATSLQIAGTDLTATAAEFNLLDGDSTVGTTTVASGDGLLTNDGGTMRQTNIDTFDTYLSGTTKTLTNKTLTSPVLTTPKFADGGFIADANGAEMLVFQTVSSAANALEVTNAAASGAVVIGAMGSDTNVDIDITPKGTGEVNIAAGNLNYAGTAITATGAELNTLDGITAVVGELNTLDLGSTATGIAIANKAVILDSSKDYVGIRNITMTGDLETTGDLFAVGTVQYGNLSDGSITITAFVDEDNMASDSATRVPTQQSVKKYVDDSVASAATTGKAIAMAIVFG